MNYTAKYHYREIPPYPFVTDKAASLILLIFYQFQKLYIASCLLVQEPTANIKYNQIKNKSRLK